MNVRPDDLQVMIQSYMAGPGAVVGGLSLVNTDYLLFLYSLTKSFITKGARGEIVFGFLCTN